MIQYKPHARETGLVLGDCLYSHMLTHTGEKHVRCPNNDIGICSLQVVESTCY